MLFYAKDSNGEYQPVKSVGEITLDDLPGPQTYVYGERDTCFMPNEIITGTLKIRHAKTRRRFIKFLMANGIPRNTAKHIADLYHSHGFSWHQAQVHMVLGIDLRGVTDDA